MIRIWGKMHMALNARGPQGLSRPGCISRNPSLALAVRPGDVASSPARLLVTSAKQVAERVLPSSSRGVWTGRLWAAGSSNGAPRKARHAGTQGRTRSPRQAARVDHGAADGRAQHWRRRLVSVPPRPLSAGPHPPLLRRPARGSLALHTVNSRLLCWPWVNPHRRCRWPPAPWVTSLG